MRRNEFILKSIGTINNRKDPVAAVRHPYFLATSIGIFIVLAESGIIDHGSLTFMIPMAGTRNILVHGYDKVDDALIFGIQKKHLSDFHIFLQQIRNNHLSKGQGNQDAP
jgi:uncharacterized protein YutE (UPF0331/DUF86 family)